MTTPTDSASAAPQVSVVLPTYNEALTLPVIVPRILNELQKAQLDAEIVIVDDDSPDGTAEVARKLSDTLPVRLIHRKSERGLATAVMAGFAHSRAEVCLVMDADGSHPVEALPNMVRLVLSDRADLVVGSRHIPGGGTRNWSVFSQLKSRLSALLAFGVTSMTDPTTGFMAVRRSLLRKLALNPVGWKIVLEIAVKAAPARIAEVPIVFSDRELGESKQSLVVFGQYLQHLAQLYAFRFPALAQLVRFCIVGFSGVFVDLATVIALKERLGLDPRLCAVFGFSMAVSTNFLLNRRWTFRGQNKAPALASYLTFAATSLLGLVVRVFVMHILMTLAAFEQGYGYILNNLVGIGFATLVNFVGAKYFAFAPERWEFDAERNEPPASPPLSVPWAGFGVLSAIALVGFAASRLLRPVAYGVSESRLVAMAQNITQDLHFLVRPSSVTGGKADWLSSDLPQLSQPPLYPALLSLSQLPFGSYGSAVLSVVCLGATALALAGLMRMVDAGAARISTALFLCSPAVLHQFGHAETELLTTALGMCALWAFVIGCRDGQPALAATGGLLGGLTFTTQLWLVTPYLLAATAYALVQRAVLREAKALRRFRVTLAVAGLTLLLGASWHLMMVASASPADLKPWLSSVYFGVFTGQGAAADRFRGDAQDGVSIFFYARQLYRDHAHILLLSLLGLPALLRATRKTSVVRTASMAFAASLGLVLFSVPARKDPLYALTVLPFCYGLGGLALDALLRSDRSFRHADVAVAHMTSALAGLALLVSATLALVLHSPLFAGGPAVLVRHSLLVAGVGAVAWLWTRNARLVPYGLLALGLVGLLCWASAIW